MLNWLFNWNSRQPEAEPDQEQDWGPGHRPTRDGGRLELRRWVGSKPGVNKDQYQDVTGRSINADLHANLRTLIHRCTHEVTTNSNVFGMADTHCVDLLGPTGPEWLVLPRSPTGMSKQSAERFAEYQLEAEDYLERWCACCDRNQEQSLNQILEMEVLASFTTGNSYTQITSKAAGGWDNCPGDLRLHPIHAERILHSWTTKTSGGNQIFLGHEVDDFGKTLSYLVRDSLPYDFNSGSYNATQVPFRNMIHGYRKLEPGQVCGVPLIACALDDIASLRRFDFLTMQIVNAASSLGIVFEDAFDGAKPVKGAASGKTESVKFNGANLIHAPAKKRVKTVASEHPSAEHQSFRDSRFRDIGRCLHMPKLIARMDASGLSYSAARMESALYSRSVRKGQQTIKRRYSGLLNSVLREAELSGQIQMRPAQIEIGASFASLPSVDPSKDSKKRDMDLNSLSTSLIQVWTEAGTKPRDQIEHFRRTVALLNDVSPGLGEKYLENLVSSKPESLDAMALAGDPLPGEDPDADEAIEQLDAMLGGATEQ